jgi:23S rRNA (guanosine2251-2'-O)-methyltransferase
LLNPQRQLHRLIGTRDALDGLGSLLDRARKPAEILVTERATLDELLGPNAVHQGLALKAGPLPELTADDLVARCADNANAVVLVLDQVTDPHNIGAILRSATAFGASAVIVQDRHSPEQTGVLAKAASGTLEKMPLIRVTNLVRTLETLKKGGFWVAGLAADGRTTIGGAKLSGKIALCLGSEGDGLRRLTREACDLLLRLPMVPGAVESLNVSNAAAVALYAARQEALEEFSTPTS